MTSTALATRSNGAGASLQRVEPVGSSIDMRTFGEACARSGFFRDSRDAAQAIVKIQAGAELGFPPVASMTGIHFFDGKLTISANLMAAAVKRFGEGKYNYRVEQLDDNGCRLVFFEGGKSVGEAGFSREDAQRAGLTNKDNWKKYPRNMYFARALSNGAKWYCPDVFGGPIYTPDELGVEVDGETGEVKNPQAPPVNLPLNPPMGQRASDLVDDPDLSDTDDFKMLWDNIAEGKGLDYPTARGLLIALCHQRSTTPEQAAVEVRRELIAKLRNAKPDWINNVKQRAAQRQNGSGSSPAAEQQDPAPSPGESAPAAGSEPDVSGAEAEAPPLEPELWHEFVENAWQLAREQRDDRAKFDEALHAALRAAGKVKTPTTTSPEWRRLEMDMIRKGIGHWTYLRK